MQAVSPILLLNKHLVQLHLVPVNMLAEIYLWTNKLSVNSNVPNHASKNATDYESKKKRFVYLIVLVF
jgi:hypothetical protein